MINLNKGSWFRIRIDSPKPKIQLTAFGSAKTMTLSHENSADYKFEVVSVVDLDVVLVNIWNIKSNTKEMNSEVSQNVLNIIGQNAHINVLDLSWATGDHQTEVGLDKPIVQKCTCDSLTMFRNGCQCGGFESEMKAKDPNYIKKDIYGLF